MQQLAETSFLSSRENYFDTDFYNLGSVLKTLIMFVQTFLKNTLNSYAARLNYTFKGDICLLGTVRADGSSVLAKAIEWVTFSIGCGRMEDEMKKAS
jgi:hypothetical protein